MKKIIDYVLVGFVKAGYFMFGIDFIVKLLLFHASGRILSISGAKVGKNARIYTPLFIHNADKDFSNLTIGDNVHIGRSVFIDLTDRVEIGDNVTISMKSIIITHFDVGKSPLKQFFPFNKKKVLIGDGVYIGVGATILHGVKIGKNSLVGACSLVNKNVEKNSLSYGIPAKSRCYL